VHAFPPRQSLSRDISQTPQTGIHSQFKRTSYLDIIPVIPIRRYPPRRYPRHSLSRDIPQTPQTGIHSQFKRTWRLTVLLGYYTGYPYQEISHSGSRSREGWGSPPHYPLVRSGINPRLHVGIITPRNPGAAPPPSRHGSIGNGVEDLCISYEERDLRQEFTQRSDEPVHPQVPQCRTRPPW
jgi:hypothetical protein